MTEEEYSFITSSRKTKILKFFKDHPGEGYSTKELSRKLEIPQSSLSRALNDLNDMGFLDAKREGKYKLYLMEKDIQKRLDRTFEDLHRARQYALERREEGGSTGDDSEESATGQDG